MTGSTTRTNDSPLIETKLYAPRWRPAGMVSRPRLTERLNLAVERKLTLISAPAGFGKTTMLAEWSAQTSSSTRSIGWVSLDHRDNDPTLFWDYVIAALRATGTEVGATALALLHTPQSPPIETILTTLINEIDAAAVAPVILILDDFHVIESHAVHKALEFLIDHLPPHLHLMIASRSDPLLPLTRLRGRGELSEFRATDLRFSADETTGFLTDAMGLGVSYDDILALDLRTEGWITGLQLAALSMQGRADVSGFIRSFAGDDRYIVDFLVEEVLKLQSEDIRNFLLQTSILDRLCGPLCDAVTGSQDGKRVLETLEQSNLFLVPLDDKRYWYRYHHLFADVLRAHASEEIPYQLQKLRQRASAWFEERGMAAEAIEQATSIRDHDTVARLLIEHAEKFERLGLYTSVAAWSAMLPEEMLHVRPRLALIAASSAARTQPNLKLARTLLALAECAIEAMENDPEFDLHSPAAVSLIGPAGLDSLKGETLALKLQISRDLTPDEMVTTARRALELIPPRQHQLRGMIYLIIGGVQGETTSRDVALASLELSIEEADLGSNPLLRSCALEQRGQLLVEMGRLQDGRRAYEEAIAAGRLASIEADWSNCGPYARLIEVLVEQGELEEAASFMGYVKSLAANAPLRSFVLHAHVTAARVLLAQGDNDAALNQLARAESFALGTRSFRFGSFLAASQLNLFLQMEDLDRAALLARERGLTASVEINPENEEEITAFARYLIARGDSSAAVTLLNRILPVVRDRGRVHHEIDVLVLRSVAIAQIGDPRQALGDLGRATALGEPGSFTWTFVSAGPRVAELLGTLRDAVNQNRFSGETGSPSYLSYLALATQPKSGPITHMTNSTLSEPLTKREIETIRLIAAGMRNQEIADHLYISLTTVKRHIANAYGKLGVTHRVDAITRATEFDLL